MFQYTNYELAVVVSVPIITILLIWTLVIFHNNKKRWRAYDIAVVAILVESVLRNLSVIGFVALQKVDTSAYLDVDLCIGFVWLFSSTHTFQASCLTTLAIIGLFSVKLYGKQQNLRHYLTATHVIYHLFCLTTLCACVGVAAILAKQGDLEVNSKNCRFMPYQLDVKFSAFIVVLHVFLAVVSFVTFLYICVIYWRLRRGGFDYLKKSTSDLSELSLSTVNPNEANKNFYDTYTIQRNGSYGRYDSPAPLTGYTTIWKSDISNVSTTVSSTNSRRPLNKESRDEEHCGTGLETIHPILVVCYLFYHIPVIVLCVFPDLIAPWSVATVALWLGLLQDVLIPVGLGLVDSRFGQWVSKVYRCSSKREVEGKLPHVGLDGKFRHFGSQPQSLETNQMLPDRAPTGRSFQNTEHKFPITNGSLYTSIDGRVPVIHNYRRHNNENRVVKLESNIVNLNMHSTNLNQREAKIASQPPPQTQYRCTNCDKSHCNSSANLNFSSTSDLIRNSVYNLNIRSQKQILLKPYLRHVSLSQNSLRQMPLGVPLRGREYTLSALSLNPDPVGRAQLRLSKSYDSLNELQSDLTEFKRRQQTSIQSVDSDEEYFSDSVNRQFDTMSTESSYSITTEANCDFEFYQNDDKSPTRPAAGGKLSHTSSKSGSITDLGKNFRIRRSNSKRSLENLQAYIDVDAVFDRGAFRTSSFVTKDERKRPVNASAEHLRGGREGTFLDSPVIRSDRNGNHGKQYFAGSVPDLKKVFISEYI